MQEAQLKLQYLSEICRNQTVIPPLWGILPSTGQAASCKICTIWVNTNDYEAHLSLFNL